MVQQLLWYAKLRTPVSTMNIETVRWMSAGLVEVKVMSVALLAGRGVIHTLISRVECFLRQCQCLVVLGVDLAFTVDIRRVNVGSLAVTVDLDRVLPLVLVLDQAMQALVSALDPVPATAWVPVLGSAPALASTLVALVPDVKDTVAIVPQMGLSTLTTKV